jgi:hypothetical protein
LVSQADIRVHSVSDQGQQMGFANPARADKQQVMLVAGGGAVSDLFEHILQQVLTLDEDRLQNGRFRPTGSKSPDLSRFSHSNRVVA